jgi:thiol-disulfide isomerase/thioredoxin
MTIKGIASSRFGLFAALGLCPLFAQPLPDPLTLFAHSQDEIQKHRTCQADSERTTSMNGMSAPVPPATTSSFYGPPDRMRIESDDVTIVVDGQFTWMYVASLKQYAKLAAIGNLFKQAATGDLFKQAPAGDLFKQAPAGDLLTSLGVNKDKLAASSKKFFSGQRTLRGETLEIDGQRIECWVVETRMDKVDLSPWLPSSLANQKLPEMSDFVYMFWFEKETGLQRQTTISGKIKMALPTGTQSMEMKTKELIRYKFDEPLPDSLFQFTPPAGAKEVDELFASMSNKPGLAGKAAPPFQVKSLDGAAYALSDLKGKVVVLDFWATWCRPCREAIPSVDKLYREFKDKDVIVLGVDVGEAPGIVARFVKTAGISYPVVLTANTEIAYDYRITAYPTYIVIGRDGMVAGENVGSNEAALRSLVQEAGATPVSQPRP